MAVANLYRTFPRCAGFPHQLAAACDDGSVRLFGVEGGEPGAQLERTLTVLQVGAASTLLDLLRPPHRRTYATFQGAAALLRLASNWGGAGGRRN